MSAALSRILELLRAEPARASALLAVLLAVLAAAGVPNEVLTALGALLAIVLGVPVRNAVTPVDTAARAAVDTAVAAAAETVARLDPAGIGEVGEITDDAREAITDATADAVDGVLGAAGLNPKGRKLVIQ